MINNDDEIIDELIIYEIDNEELIINNLLINIIRYSDNILNIIFLFIFLIDNFILLYFIYDNDKFEDWLIYLIIIIEIFRCYFSRLLVIYRLN